MQKSNGTWRVSVLCFLSVMGMTAVLPAQETPQAPKPAAPTAAGPALLDVIPNDATAFVAIRNLRELDRDIQAVSTQLGFPLGAEGMFPAPLEWLKGSLQMTEGLRENAGAALVLLNASDAKTVEELPDRLVLYIPATDPKALLTGMGAEEGTDGLYKLDLGGSPSVAVAREGFALVAKAPEGTDATPKALIAAGKAKGDGVIKAMAPDRVKSFARQDVFVWINFRTLSDDVRKEIMSELGEFFQNLGGSMGQTQPEDAQANQAVQQIEQFLTQGDEVSLGILLDSKIGLNISAYSRVKEGTDLAKRIAAVQPPKNSLLTGLPDDDFVLAGGAVVAATPETLDQMRKAAEEMAKSISEMDKDEGTPLTPENLKPIIDLYLELLKNTERAGLSISKIGAAEGEGGLIGLTAVAQVKDAKAWRGQVHQGFDKIKQIVAGVAKADQMEQEKVDEVMNAIVWQENAGEVAGASVDVLRVELDKISAVPPEALQQTKAVIGPEGVLIRIATVGDKQVVIAFGGGEERLAKVVELVKQEQAPLAKNAKIAKVAGRLPTDNRVCEFYFSIDNLIGIIDAAATRLESPLPVKLSLANAAPIAATTVNVDNLSQQIDFLIPIELIVSGSQMVRQQLLPMMMMGGMGGGQMEMEQPGSEEEGSEEETPKPRPAQPQE